METLTIDTPKVSTQMDEKSVKNNKVSALILLTENAFFAPEREPWKLSVLGKSMQEWLALACEGLDYSFAVYDGKSDILEVVRNNMRDSEYTLVLFSDTPLLRKKTVEEILDYCFIKNVSVCKLTRGYVFSNDFIKNATSLYTAQPQYFDEEDFMTVYNYKQLMMIEEIMKNRVLSFHMKNGVRIIDGGSVTIDADVTIESGVVIHPGNRIYGKTFIAKNSELFAGNIIKDCYIGESSRIEYSVVKNAEVPAFSNIGPFEKIIK